MDQIIYFLGLAALIMLAPDLPKPFRHILAVLAVVIQFSVAVGTVVSKLTAAGIL